ncbi:Golgi apparatus membrane protein tvp18 [Podila minutissima]|uniref:Golgi apparatus membrane protein tvp18 n=1 Tax=Podila minutissima TaxID=64525 RepID=A0A9P5SJZ6_9FUNG|nr:Golgi apparatus membrane protein tvp18 [Podila minutissima]
MSLIDEFRSGNFSLYGQWQVSLIIFAFIPLNLLWSIIAWVIAFLLVFIEVPMCLKCCPTSPKFDNFLHNFQNSYFRAGAYLVFAILMWIGFKYTVLQIVSALLLTGAAVSYTIAAVRHQTPASSSITGGTGVSTIV